MRISKAIQRPVRVLLFQPKFPVRSIPLGLAYLAAALEEEACDIQIINASAPYKHYTRASLLKDITTFEPHIFGITLSTPFVKQGYDFITSLSRLPALIVAGGPHPTIRPEEAIKHGADIAVIGEGEETIKELLQALMGNIDLEKVRGIVYRKNSEIIRTPAREPITDFDKLPMPDFSLVRYAKIVAYPVERIRGCGMDCEFCTVKGKPRCASVERLMKQITNIVDKPGCIDLLIRSEVLNAPYDFKIHI